MTTLAFILQSPDVTASWVSRVAAAIAVQLARDVVPAWDLAWADVDTRVYTRIKEAPSGVLPIVILPDSDIAGALGYHDVTAEGVSYARVFTRGQTLDGVSLTISHEVIEALVDPTADSWVKGPDGVMYALEAANPVEGDGYAIEGGGNMVMVSDFVLPRWFDPTTPPHETTDFLGRLKGAFQIRPTGYAILRDTDGQVTTIPPGFARSQARRHPAARTARRARSTGRPRQWSGLP